MNHGPRIESTSFDLLRKLPKLSELSVQYPWEDITADTFHASIATIGQLTQLTSLEIFTANYYESEFEFRALTNLTGLLDLSLDGRKAADFGSLSKLTKLILRH